MISSLLLSCSFAVSHAPGPSAERPWQLVHSDILHGISGMALVESRDDANTFLIVHDNKKPGEGRVALVVIARGASPVYKPLAWEGEVPVDLEGLTTVPSSPESFLCLASAGTAYVIKLDAGRTKVGVQKSFKLPNLPEGVNFEGIALQKVGDQLMMAWGHRGDAPAPGLLFLTKTDVDLSVPTSAASVPIAVPWPTAKGTRGISDLKIDPSGTIFLSAAADAGDDGPFQSVLFIGGVVDAGGALRGAMSPRLFWTDQHKIEAFDLVPGKAGGLIFGTDDENLGGCVWNNFWPE